MVRSGQCRRINNTYRYVLYKYIQYTHAITHTDVTMYLRMYKSRGGQRLPNTTAEHNKRISTYCPTRWSRHIPISMLKHRKMHSTTTNKKLIQRQILELVYIASIYLTTKPCQSLSWFHVGWRLTWREFEISSHKHIWLKQREEEIKPIYICINITKK